MDFPDVEGKEIIERREIEMARTTKATVITGFDAPFSEMPAADANEGMDRYNWIQAHMKSVIDIGHLSDESCKAIAEKLEIVDGLKVARL